MHSGRDNEDKKIEQLIQDLQLLRKISVNPLATSRDPLQLINQLELKDKDKNNLFQKASQQLAKQEKKEENVFSLQIQDMIVRFGERRKQASSVPEVKARGLKKEAFEKKYSPSEDVGKSELQLIRESLPPGFESLSLQEQWQKLPAAEEMAKKRRTAALSLNSTVASSPSNASSPETKANNPWGKGKIYDARFRHLDDETPHSTTPVVGAPSASPPPNSPSPTGPLPGVPTSSAATMSPADNKATAASNEFQTTYNAAVAAERARIEAEQAALEIEMRNIAAEEAAQALQATARSFLDEQLKLTNNELKKITDVVEKITQLSQEVNQLDSPSALAINAHMQLKEIVRLRRELESLMPAYNKLHREYHTSQDEQSKWVELELQMGRADQEGKLAGEEIQKNNTEIAKQLNLVEQQVAKIRENLDRLTKVFQQKVDDEEILALSTSSEIKPAVASKPQLMPNNKNAQVLLIFYLDKIDRKYGNKDVSMEEFAKILATTPEKDLLEDKGIIEFLKENQSVTIHSLIELGKQVDKLEQEKIQQTIKQLQEEIAREEKEGKALEQGEQEAIEEEKKVEELLKQQLKTLKEHQERKKIADKNKKTNDLFATFMVPDPNTEQAAKIAAEKAEEEAKKINEALQQKINAAHADKARIEKLRKIREEKARREQLRAVRKSHIKSGVVQELKNKVEDNKTSETKSLDDDVLFGLDSSEAPAENEVPGSDPIISVGPRLRQPQSQNDFRSPLVIRSGSPRPQPRPTERFTDGPLDHDVSSRIEEDGDNLDSRLDDSEVKADTSSDSRLRPRSSRSNPSSSITDSDLSTAATSPVKRIFLEDTDPLLTKINGNNPLEATELKQISDNPAFTDKLTDTQKNALNRAEGGAANGHVFIEQYNPTTRAYHVRAVFVKGAQETAAYIDAAANVQVAAFVKQNSTTTTLYIYPGNTQEWIEAYQRACQKYGVNYIIESRAPTVQHGALETVAARPAQSRTNTNAPSSVPEAPEIDPNDNDENRRAARARALNPDVDQKQLDAHQDVLKELKQRTANRQSSSNQSIEEKVAVYRRSNAFNQNEGKSSQETWQEEIIRKAGGINQRLAQRRNANVDPNATNNSVNADAMSNVNTNTNATNNANNGNATNNTNRVPTPVLVQRDDFQKNFEDKMILNVNRGLSYTVSKDSVNTQMLQDLLNLHRELDTAKTALKADDERATKGEQRLFSTDKLNLKKIEEAQAKIKQNIQKVEDAVLTQLDASTRGLLTHGSSTLSLISLSAPPLGGDKNKINQKKKTIKMYLDILELGMTDATSPRVKKIYERYQTYVTQMDQFIKTGKQPAPQPAPRPQAPQIKKLSS